MRIIEYFVLIFQNLWKSYLIIHIYHLIAAIWGMNHSHGGGVHLRARVLKCLHGNNRFIKKWARGGGGGAVGGVWNYSTRWDLPRSKWQKVKACPSQEGAQLTNKVSAFSNTPSEIQISKHSNLTLTENGTQAPPKNDFLALDPNSKHFTRLGHRQEKTQV